MSLKQRRKSYTKAIAVIASITNDMVRRRKKVPQSTNRERNEKQESENMDLTEDNTTEFSMREWATSKGIIVGIDLSKYPYREVSIPIQRLTVEEIECAVTQSSVQQATANETIVFSDDEAELTTGAPATESICASEAENDESSDQSDVDLAPAPKKCKLAANDDSAQPIVGNAFSSEINLNPSGCAHAEEANESVVYDGGIDESLDESNATDKIEDIAEVWLAASDDLRDLLEKDPVNVDYWQENVLANNLTGTPIGKDPIPPHLDNNEQMAENDDEEERLLVSWEEEDIASESGSASPAPSNTNCVRPSVNEDSCSTIRVTSKFIARHRMTVLSSNSSVSREDYVQNVAKKSILLPEQSRKRKENVTNTSPKPVSPTSLSENGSGVPDDLQEFIRSLPNPTTPPSPSSDITAVTGNNQTSPSNRSEHGSLCVHIPQRSQTLANATNVVVDASIFKTPTPKAAQNKPMGSNERSNGSFSERSATLVVRDGSSALVSNVSPDTCAFRVRLLDSSPRTYCCDRWKMNDTSHRPNSVQKLSLLVHRSCSNTSEEVNASSASNLSVYLRSEKVKPKKCFPASSKILYNHTIKCGSLEVAINYFNENDPKISLYLCGKLNRYDNLNRFSGILFTTAPIKRLLSKYFGMKNENIIVLNYNDPLMIDHIRVTAIEVPNYPGGAIFYIQDESVGKYYLHVGDHRISSEIEENILLANSEIHYIYFDPAILNQVIYHFPGDDDRYSDLMLECYKFMEKNREAGIHGMIAVGTFDIGMEHLVLRLAEVFDVSIWLNELRRKFIRFLEIDNCENVKRIIRPLIRRVASTSSMAVIHVLDVSNIHRDYLSTYLNQENHGNFNRVLAIRPRGTDFHVQNVIENQGGIEIIDVPNPLIGDIEEYDRLVRMTIEKERRILEHAQPPIILTQNTPEADN